MPFLHKCLSVILLLIAISSSASAATQATASVSNNQVFQGDTFILTIEVNDTGSEYQLDTSALTDDFKVSGPSRSQSTSIINGDINRKITWVLRLQANKVGNFTIPALAIGDLLTDPITIQVKEAGEEQQSTSGDTIFIENSVDKTQVYLDQPIILESKIYVSENIVDGDVQAPTLAAANIERISNDNQQTQVILNGLRYKVFTYQYQITPTQAGDVRITSPLLVGSIRKNVSVSDWQNRIISQPINIRGNSIAITVKPMPANYQGDWLISEDVHLVENNNLQAASYTVGDPITRSISLRVASISVDKMPEIKLNYDSSLRYYPDQDDLKQGTLNGVLYSQRTITHAIIADKSGELVLPEIRIPWWNSKTEQQEFATLPAQTLTIKAALPNTNNNNQGNASNSASNIASNVINNDASTQGALSAASQLANNDAQNKLNEYVAENEQLTKRLLFWQISALILLILVISLCIYLYFVKTNKQLKAVVTPSNNNKTATPYQQLLQACEQSTPQQVYTYLLRYFQSQHADITQLQQITVFSPLPDDQKQQLQSNLQQLELACSGKTHQWDAKQLIKLIKMHQKTAKIHNSHSINTLNP